MDRLKFRRQFLLSPKRCEALKNWKQENVEDHILYVHQDCHFTRITTPSTDLILIGYMILPGFPDKSDTDILKNFSSCTTTGEIAEKLYPITGRFVLIAKLSNDYFIFNDACGLKQLFYMKYEQQVYVASQPLLFKLVTDWKEGNLYYNYLNSKYVKTHIEHWIPCGSSLYDNVHQLIPNHYLDIMNYRQVRYWPNKEIKRTNFEDALEQFTSLLKNTMTAANKRFKLALPLTAGWDSRVILSACKDIADDIFFYTLKYRKLTEDANDIKIPYIILSELGYQHHVIDCHKVADKEFLDQYKKNTHLPHINDWATIANEMYRSFPSDFVAVKGNCAEIGRCHYYHSGRHPSVSSAKKIAKLVRHWNHFSFIREGIAEWYDGIKEPEKNYGYALFDLFYWEHRMGSWQAQSQLEWDIVQQSFTPYNNRELLDIMLAVEPKYRCKPHYFFFMKSIQKLWKETLIAPVNPKRSLRKRIKQS